MALQDPNAPFSPWDVPPSADELEEAMARAYGDPAQPQILDDIFAPIAGLPTTTPPPAAPFPPRKPDPIPFDPEEAKYHPGRADDKSTANQQKQYDPDTKPRPRTDAARIGAFGAPLPPEEVALQGLQWPDPDARLSPDEEAQIEIDGGNIEMPDDFVGRTEVDAISGVGQNVAFPAPDQGPPGVRGEVPDEYLSDEQLGARMSGRSLEEQEMFRGQVEGGRDRMRQAAQEVIETQALWEAEKNAKALRRAMQIADERSAELDKEATAIGNEKIDPLRNISTTSKIAGVLAAFVGGFGMAKTGRNVGLEAIDSMIDNELQVQTANLNNRKQMLASQQSAIGDQLARGKDLFQAQETVRLATYDQLVRKLEADVQQYDPRGTRALKTMDTINAIKSKRAELLGKYRDEELKRAERLLKEERERAQLLEQIRHNKAQEGIGWKNAKNDEIRALADKTKAEAEAGSGALLTPDELRARGIAIPPNAQVPPMTLKQAEALAKTAKSVEDWNKATRENSPDERNRQFATGEIVDDEGNPVQFRTTEAASKIAKLTASSDLSVQLIDRLTTARKRYGWSSDLFKSKEWREMQSDFAQLILEKKNLDELGVIAGPDMDLMQKALGTTDPTELRDPTPGFDRIRKTTIEKTNAVIRAEAALPKGRTVKRWEPPPPPPEPEKTPEEIEFQQVLGFGSAEDSGIDIEKDFGVDPRLSGAQRIQAVQQSMREAGGIPPSIRSRIDRIARASHDPQLTEEQRKEAGSQLEQLAKNAESQAVRGYAVQVGTVDPAAAAQVTTD